MTDRDETPGNKKREYHENDDAIFYRHAFVLVSSGKVKATDTHTQYTLREHGVNRVGFSVVFFNENIFFGSLQ